MSSSGNDNEEDVWDVFGSDDDDEDENDDSIPIESTMAHQVASHLGQVFRQQDNSQERIIGWKNDDTDDASLFHDFLDKELTALGMYTSLSLLGSEESAAAQSSSELLVREQERLDALVVFAIDDGDLHQKQQSLGELMDKRLLPGGILVTIHTTSTNGGIPSPTTATTTTTTKDCFIDPKNALFDAKTKRVLYVDPQRNATSRTKKRMRAHTSICPWLSSSASQISAEEVRLYQATLSLSSQEVKSSRLTETSITHAVQAIHKHGYCIVPGLLSPKECREWNRVFLESIEQATTRLLQDHGVDVLHPSSGSSEPQSYRELSMREDLRLDLRSAPALNRHRKRIGTTNEPEDMGNRPLVLPAHIKETPDFLRGHPSVLAIVRQAMNTPSDPYLAKGNLGRYNFSGTIGTYPDMTVSPMGAIVSFPGAADQALHADTPHLFEHVGQALPPHYINCFAPASDFDEKVGGTAFVHGSHHLEFTARHLGGEDAPNSNIYPYLVRPQLTVGDVILFDCRLLHFGLMNRSDSGKQRVMLYTNMTQAWFQDPKNWETERPLFPETDEDA